MADAKVSLIIEAIDHATAPLRKVTSTLGGIAQGFKEHLGGRIESTVFGGIESALAKIASFPAQIMETGAQFEQFKTALDAVEGSAEKGAQSMEWLKKTARQTPMDLSEVTKAFILMKNMGMDPMNGQLMAIINGVSKLGFKADAMQSIVMQMGQAWTKNKLQAQDMNIMMERGIPVLDILQKKLGKTGDEIIDMRKKSELTRPVLLQLMEGIQEWAGDAAERMSKTWTGMLSNLHDFWEQFVNTIAESGFFDWMVGKLRLLMQTLNELEATGKLKEIAKMISDNLVRAAEAAWSGLNKLFDLMKEWVGDSGKEVAAVDVLIKTIQKLGEVLKPVVDTLALMLETIANITKSLPALNKSLEPVSNVLNTINTGFKSAGEMVNKALLGGKQAFGDIPILGGKNQPTAAPAPSGAAAAANVQGGKTNVGGEVKVKVEADQGTKASVTDIKSKNPKVPLSTDAGPALAVP